MKKTYIVLLVVIVVVLLLVILGNNKKVEAPEVNVDVNTPLDTATYPAGSPEAENAGPDDTLPPTQAVKEFTVVGKNFSFAPSTLTVKKGDKVKITFSNTGGFHDFVIDEYNVRSKQGQSPFTDVLEFTANKAGSFEYYCSVGTHRQMGMKGTLTVTE